MLQVNQWWRLDGVITACPLLTSTLCHPSTPYPHEKVWSRHFKNTTNMTWLDLLHTCQEKKENFLTTTRPSNT